MISNLDDLIKAFNYAQTVQINKVSVTATTGLPYSLWSAPTTMVGEVPTTASLCDRNTVGAIGFTQPQTGRDLYIARMFWVTSANGTDLQVFDRIAHNGGLVANTTTLQTVNVTAVGAASERIGAADFSDLVWWVECYSVTGSTAVNATVTYTNGQGQTGRTTTVGLGGSNSGRRVYPIFGQDNEPIRSVQSIQLVGSTGGSGNIGVVCSRMITTMSLGLGNASEVADWSHMGLPKVHRDACLYVIVYAGATSTGNLIGTMRFIEG